MTKPDKSQLARLRDVLAERLGRPVTTAEVLKEALSTVKPVAERTDDDPPRVP